MASESGSVGYTIMGQTANLTDVQKTVTDTLHKEGQPQKIIAKEGGHSLSDVSKHVNRKLSGRIKCGRKRWDNCSPERTLKQSPFKKRLIMSELRLESMFQEPSHTDTSSTPEPETTSEAYYVGYE